MRSHPKDAGLRDRAGARALLDQPPLMASRRLVSKLVGKQGSSEMPNAAMEDFARWCERKLAKSGDQLEPIESGQFNVVPRTSR